MIAWLLLPCHARSTLLPAAARLRVSSEPLVRITRWMAGEGVTTPRTLQVLFAAWGTDVGAYQAVPDAALALLLGAAGDGAV